LEGLLGQAHDLAIFLAQLASLEIELEVFETGQPR
jgi:hypothetical protein